MLITVDQRLKAAGKTQRDLTEKLWSMGVCVSHSWVTAYCRSWSRDYGRKDIWEMIDKALVEMEVS